MATQAVQKHLGAFYTSPAIAEVLVRWALRNQGDRVLDPACGEGVFLAASAARLLELGGKPSSQVVGVEIDPGVYEASRDKALLMARGLGVKLSELASSWAPFILHATEFLAPGGRLAMVVPAEITHAAYARPVVQYLAQKFQSIQLAGFGERLFGELNEDTFLLFADGYGRPCADFRMGRFQSLAHLSDPVQSGRPFGTQVSIEELQNSNGRLRDHFLSEELGSLYRFLAGDPRVRRLGTIAKVGIGYVTGANEYFQLSREEALRLQIARRFLRRTLPRSGFVAGLEFSRRDWAHLRKQGEKVYLLSLPGLDASRLPRTVQEYIRRGESQGVNKAYKCAVREPWFSVPHSGPADAFLTYMSGEAPRMAWNAAKVLATNSTHEVRFSSGRRISPWKLALAFWCSLSQLSCEIEGHPLGGGMLKLEPTEAERALVIEPSLLRLTRDQFEELDSSVRSKSLGYAIDLADEWILRDTLGLSWDQIQVLRDGVREIRQSRRKKSAVRRSD